MGKGISIRHGRCVAYVSNPREVADIMHFLCVCEAEHNLQQHISEFSCLMKEAATPLGLSKKASSEDIRKGL
eukprot:2753639-Pyramimonas_sp.AAC.1